MNNLDDELISELGKFILRVLDADKEGMATDGQLAAMAQIAKTLSQSAI